MAVEEVRNDSYYIGTFDCQQRYVRFDLNAFAEMEKIYGSMEAANEALSRGTMQDIRKILWLGLIHDQAVLDEVTGEPIKYNLTVYQVGKWLTPSNMKEVMQKLMDAINGSLPEDAEGKPATDNKVINMNAANAGGATENLTQPPQVGTGHSTITQEQ